MGECSAVGSKSGLPVPPVRSGAETTYTCDNGWANPGDSPSPSQPKTGQGPGQRPGVESQREALGSSLTPSVDRAAGALDAVAVDFLDDYSILQLISFFEMLDRWDREAHAN